MIASVFQKSSAPVPVSVPAGLPAGADVRHVEFVAAQENSQRILLKLPSSFQRLAVEAQADAVGALQILSIPSTPPFDSSLSLMAEDWAAAGSPDKKSPIEMMTLQGAQVYWSTGRIAILAPSDRLESVRSALIESAWYESELQDIERTVGNAWPEMEADLPLAFAFSEKALNRRSQLLNRFQQILLIRARLARLGPQVHQPHLHPPTLASQVSERFRERCRMIHRHQFLQEQVEVFEKIYDTCGQRASDFVQSRTGHMLEWFIIVLLLTQLLLWIFELLTSTGT